MAYEEGMSFDLNTITSQVTIIFRGKKTKLPGAYKDWTRAKEDAEAFCRKNGWKG
jgi:hypothetical protein